MTLEHELFNSGNDALLKRVFVDLYPQSEERWTNEVEGAKPQNRAASFVALLKDKKARKGDFAQQLAQLIEAGEPFVVPDYLHDAICKVAEP